jgi:hypothetical protein
MKSNPNYHALINLGLMVLIIYFGVWRLWNWIPLNTVCKSVASAILVFLVLYFGHRIIPRLTNGIIERIFRKK